MDGRVLQSKEEPRSESAVWVICRSGTLYAATKGAMNQLTKNLACEWAKDGIRCNTVAPW